MHIAESDKGWAKPHILSAIKVKKIQCLDPSCAWRLLAAKGSKKDAFAT